MAAATDPSPLLVDLPDVNVWLAMSVPDHPHHLRARRYWEDEATPEVAFCRVTALGFLRLLTHPRVMGGEPLSASEAWAAYRSYRALPEILLAVEPGGCEPLLGSWASEPAAAARLWTDAYLAAFVRAGRFRLVSFDQDFHRFELPDALVLTA